MRSLFALVVAVLLVATSRPSCWAGSSSKAKDKELDYKYNKIFFGGGFTVDLATTRQWLKELDQQLEYDNGQEEKYENVRKLLAFDKIDPDCDLTKGSGNELVAYYRFFIDPNATSTTFTIKNYITSCLAQLYEQCKGSFVDSTAKAVGRLSRYHDYQRMVRLKELVSNESDLKVSIAQFLLEQVDERPWEEYEFKDRFNRYISEPCKTIRDELKFMMYFDVLLTMKQIKLMGESVRQWYQVRSVCKELLWGEQGTKKAVFKHLTSLVKQEDERIVRKYERVFKGTKWPLKPEETYQRLVWLSVGLKKQCKGYYYNRKARKRLSNVEEMVELGQFWRTKQCDMGAVKQVNGRLFKDMLTKYTLTIKRYLLHLRDQAFELCRSDMAERVAGSVQRLAQDPLWKKILRLRELVAKKFDSTKTLGNDSSSSRLHELVLGFMDEQAGGPLSPELERAEFGDQFIAVVHKPCKLVYHDFNYFENVKNIWRLEVADRMDPTLRDWFLVFGTCQTMMRDDAQAPVYARLIARGKRDPSYRWS